MTDETFPKCHVCEKPMRQRFMVAARKYCSPVCRTKAKTLRLHHPQMTLADLRAMRARQDNRCAICHKRENPVRGVKLVIDHDHVTNERRGLLCWTCNMALGYYERYILIDRSAYDRYLGLE